MSIHHEPHRPARLSETAPVQVYLDHEDRARLDRLTDQLSASKSAVLRRSLAALEQQLLDPVSHPALRIIGLVDDDDGTDGGNDAAVQHDRYLAEAHECLRPPRGRRRRGKS